jgi:orotate phosphoribosyltransferase-like protein
MNRRDFLKKKFNKLKSNGFVDNSLYNEYKYMRNTVVKLIRKSKREYFSSLIENYEINVWNVIKVILAKNSNKK